MIVVGDTRNGLERLIRRTMVQVDGGGRKLLLISDIALLPVSKRGFPDHHPPGDHPGCLEGPAALVVTVIRLGRRGSSPMTPAAPGTEDGIRTGLPSGGAG